jgi:hypothetical protein
MSGQNPIEREFERVENAANSLSYRLARLLQTVDATNEKGATACHSIVNVMRDVHTRIADIRTELKDVPAIRSK